MSEIEKPCSHYVCDEEGPFMPESLHCVGCCEEERSAAISAAEREAKNAALEEAARTVEEPVDWAPLPYQARMAQRIRSLKETP